MEKLLEVKNLETSFFTHLGEVQAVRDTSFYIEKGEVLGIVGESGSGKSVSALSVMRLVDSPGKIIGGQILFKGKDIAKISEQDMTDIRGKEIAMIFQDPMTSLNPVYTIKNQMIEVIRKHTKKTKQQALDRAIEMLKLVEIPEPIKRINSYPHEFSGGMKQRAMIATALSCEPNLLIADEPTTALDVTIQAQIIALMKNLQDKLGMSIMIITHDLGVIAEICTRIIVMYGGKIMETGTSDDIFYDPQNPYTVGLHKSVPRMDIQTKKRLVPIEGQPPDLLSPPEGCPFSTRCHHTMEICIQECPPSFKISDSHSSACWLLHPGSPSVESYKKAEVQDAE